MDRKELIKLKLQMGLSPSVVIDPHELRAMWRQLCLESLHARRDQDNSMTQRDHAAPLHPAL